MSLRKAAAWLGAGFFALSWFLPVLFNEDDIYPGWRAFWVAVGGMGNPYGLRVEMWPLTLLAACSALTNAVLVVAIGAIVGGKDFRSRLARCMMILGMFNAWWLVPLKGGIGMLGIGYVLWVLSFFLVGYGCSQPRRLIHTSPVVTP